jgi:hypothetical protein
MEWNFISSVRSSCRLHTDDLHMGQQAPPVLNETGSSVGLLSPSIEEYLLQEGCPPSSIMRDSCFRLVIGSITAPITPSLGARVACHWYSNASSKLTLVE